MSETNCAKGESNRITHASFHFDWRLVCVTALAVCALVSVGWLESRAWKNADQLSRELMVRQERRGILLRETVDRIASSLFRFQLTGNPSSEDAFHAQLREFSRLILEVKAQNVAGQSNLLAQTDAEFQRFSVHADSLQPIKGLRRDTPDDVAREIENELTLLRDLVLKLAQAEERALAERRQAAFAKIRSLKGALQASMVGLAVLVASSVLLMYRGGLAPLRAKLDRMEAARERNEKLASLGILATGVAHEIRNPLTAIKFRLFSLKKVYGDGLAKNEDFQTIRNEIDRLENIVKSFLEFARPPDPRIVPISPADVLGDLERLFGAEMAHRKVQLVIDPGETIVFKGDRQQLAQVLINLTQNAADSMPAGGTVTVRARRGAAVLSRKPEPVLLLEVIDNGAGIAPEIQDRLFDPFFSTKEGGTGLGLAIAARIVERHRGLMQFASRQGYGTTFTVVLPIAQNHSENENSPDRR